MPRLPKPRFNLKAPMSKSETLIFLIFRYRGKRLLYSTGLNILPKEWDTKTQRPHQMERRPDLWAINQQLNNLAALSKSIYIDNNYGRISVADFKEQLAVLSGRKEEVVPRLSFFEFLQQEIDQLEGQGIRHSSIKAYKVQANVFKTFAKEMGEFTYEDVDWNFRLKMIDWLANRKVKLSYGNKSLDFLRRILERARRKQLHSNTKYQGDGWLVHRKKAVGEKVILTPEELQKLADMKLHGRLKKVRDLFLIGAGTGQRFSDYSRYKPEHFYKTNNGTLILSIIAQKTDIPAKIPLNIFPWLVPILEENNYTSPKMVMQKLNDGIKDLGFVAEFNKDVLVVDQLMGRKPKVVKYYEPKYTRLTTHTCRRSFATNLYRMGYPLAQIMPMTGHTTEGHLRTYIGIDAEENAESVARSISQQREEESE